MDEFDEESSYTTDEGGDIEVLAMGPLSLVHKDARSSNNNYTESQSRGRSRSQTRSPSNNRSRSNSRARSVKSNNSRSEAMMTGGGSVYNGRSVGKGESDVVGRCVLDDLREMSTWRTKFTIDQILGGVAVMATQIPEAISFAYISKIDPFHALQTTWILNILTPLIGGRPGLLSSTSGFGAIILRHLVTNFGVNYIFYAVILSGILQVAFSICRIGQYLRILPPGITVGLVNGMCLLLYVLQLRYFKEYPTHEDTITNNTDMAMVVNTEADRLNMPWSYYYGFDLPWDRSLSQILVVVFETLLALAICYLLPRYTTVLPSSLIALLVVTGANMAITWRTQWDAPTIGDYCSSELPTNRYYKGIFNDEYALPPVFNWTTLSAVIPAGVSLFCVSLIDTMVAINVVDKYTNSDSEQDRVFFGQGFSNCVAGFFGGMAGSGQAHQSLHSLKSGGVSSVSSFMAGVYMLIIMLIGYPAVAKVPLGATAGITLYLVCNMVQWSPLFALILRFVPKSCLRQPVPVHLRLAIPDLFSTFLSSWMALFATSYGIAGYLVGVLCYASDPIGHAIIFGANEQNLTLIQLNISNKHYFSRSKPDGEEYDLEDPYNDIYPAPSKLTC